MVRIFPNEQIYICFNMISFRYKCWKVELDYNSEDLVLLNKFSSQIFPQLGTQPKQHEFPDTIGRHFQLYTKKPGLTILSSLPTWNPRHSFPLSHHHGIVQKEEHIFAEGSPFLLFSGKSHQLERYLKQRTKVKNNPHHTGKRHGGKFACPFAWCVAGCPGPRTVMMRSWTHHFGGKGAPVLISKPLQNCCAAWSNFRRIARNQRPLLGGKWQKWREMAWSSGLADEDRHHHHQGCSPMRLIRWILPVLLECVCVCVCEWGDPLIGLLKIYGNVVKAAASADGPANNRMSSFFRELWGRLFWISSHQLKGGSCVCVKGWNDE